MHSLNDEALDILFRTARTNSAWVDKPVTDDTLRQIYDLLKWGPTSSNTCPARFLFLRSHEAKERLRPALSPGNVDKTMIAPATVIVAYDLRFYETLPKLSPHNPGLRDVFADDPELARITAFRSATLQGAYMMLAARSLGLDCGPMSGFDNDTVDEAFFGERGSARHLFPKGELKSNFLCNLGYGNHTKLRPRAPRLDFDEACALL